MIRDLGEGIELDDSKERIDIDAVHRYLSEESYWAKGRSRETVELYIDLAMRVVGLYSDGRQAGFCRAAFMPGLPFVYLADVYVLPELRGRGLGEALVREMIDNGPLADSAWVLHTADMHRLYRKFGFGEPSERLMERARDYAERRSTRKASESG